MKIKAIQEYYERNCEKHGNGKVMATVSLFQRYQYGLAIF